jgi:hypothetical protein
MFSPKAYLESIISEYLVDWVDDFDESSLQIGLWKGNVELDNLSLKTRVVYVGQGVKLVLEYGHIGNVAVKIPWSKLRTGGAFLSVDDVKICLRLEFIDNAVPGGGLEAAEKQISNFFESLKMVFTERRR